MNILDQLRARGWMVAVHNDYTRGSTRFTFWLLTRGVHFIKGEGVTDDDALHECIGQEAEIDGYGPKADPGLPGLR